MLNVNDINLEILSYLDDYSLIEFCQTNKNYKLLCQKDYQLRTRMYQYLDKKHDLINIAKEYNDTHPESIIDLQKYKKIEELIILLWEKR